MLDAVSTGKNKEKILIVVVDFKGEVKDWSAEDNLQEMKDLVAACNGEVVDGLICRIPKPTATYLIGEGKVEEIALLCSANPVDTVVFSQDLKGSQQRNLEEAIKKRIIDRTQLILDIFAKHAVSGEGKMQVELAQLEYLMPRLVGKGDEMSRLGGGIGTSGPGETKLEVDRRRITDRITKLKRNLLDIGSQRNLKRKKRQDKAIPQISLVGYTNAGKSTLLNTLTHAGQITKDGLFTTLDSLSRQLILPNNQKVILSDTVGFMHELPHHLIEAFKATLEELREADLLLHVLDISHPNFRKLFDSVNDVLRQIDAYQKPMIMVLNKIDKVKDKKWLEEIKNGFKEAVCISATENENIEVLLQKIIQTLSFLVTEINVNVPIARMDLVSLAHKTGEVYSIKYYPDSINIRAVVPTHIAAQFFKD